MNPSRCALPLPLPLLAGAFFLSCLLPSSVFASEYPLESVSFLSAQEVEALKSLSMKTTHDAGARLAGPKARVEISKKSKIAVERLSEIASYFDLMRVRGVGAKMAQLIHGSGVVDCVGLGRSVPDALLLKMRVLNQEKGIASKMPDVGTLGHWIDQAKSLPAQFLP